MTPDQPTFVRILVTDAQMAELRALLASDAGSLTVLPSGDTDALQAALAFYADPENWREGCGTGPRRAAACVADGGRRAREVLGRVEARQADGEERI